MDSFAKFLLIVVLVGMAFWFLSLGKFRVPNGTIEVVKTFLIGIVDDFIRSVMRSILLDVVLGMLGVLGLGWIATWLKKQR